MCDRWDGYRTFVFWVMAYKHFTTPSFDIKTFRVHAQYVPYDSFAKRRDKEIFNAAAKKFNEKQWLYICAVNLMYGHTEAPYNTGVAVANYNQYLARMEAMDELIRHDFDVLNKNGIAPTNYKGILQLLVRNLIAFETVVILNQAFPVTKSIRKDPDNRMILKMLNPLLLRIDKAKTFVYTTEDKLSTLKTQSINPNNTFNIEIFN